MISNSHIQQYAERFGTPLYIYDGAAIETACTQLRDLLGEGVETVYSIKANPNLDVCRLILGQGLGAEVASAGELAIALRAGALASRVIAAGPAKSKDDLRGYVGRGVWLINVESWNELERLSHAAREAGRRVVVALRINPLHADSGARIRMSGKASPFGIDEEALWDRLGDYDDLGGVEIGAISVYFGTAILDAARIIENSRKVADLARRLAHRLGRPLQAVNFGGGFGVPFSDAEEPLDIEQAARGIARICAELRADNFFRTTRFIVESGRYLVATAGRFVCRVQDVKVSRGRHFVIVDGGIHHNLAASPLLRFDRKSPRIRLIGRGHESSEFTTDIVGPLCTTLDCLARDVRVRRPEIGDLVVFENAGAYGLSMSPLLFLSHDVPGEVLVMPSGGLFIRRRRKSVDLLGISDFVETT
ncbi:MAG: hypothetical protein P4L84_20515 [Isosphaeraceae bacterium]|nr:hypothetical protein [Isosphaeraceae bacterium]